MAEAIKREDASNIVSRLNECKNHLQRGNIFSCLIAFKEILEKMSSTKMLPADEKVLQNEINAFQNNLSSSAIFRDTYGPVTFHDNDIAPTLALMRQLVEIKEEEIREMMTLDEKQQEALDEPPTDADELSVQIKQLKILIEKGDYATARDMLQNREELISMLVDEYNAAGIEYRRTGRFDEALSEFKKALAVYPRDEGLYYNISRVYVSKKEWTLAAETVNEGLKINPHFGEGIQLLKYIRENGKL
jgi:tetratricopeptide (TPR) repeat protein